MEKLGKRGTPAGVVEDVAVLPERHGQGIGRAMMEHAREACRAAGCYKLALSSNLKREDAHRFYDRWASSVTASASSPASEPFPDT